MAPQVCCRSKLNRAQKTNLVNKVRMDYRIHMIMDNLPAATKMIAEMPDGTKKDMYDRYATQLQPRTCTPHRIRVRVRVSRRQQGGHERPACHAELVRVRVTVRTGRSVRLVCCSHILGLALDSGFRLGFIGSKDIPGTEPGTAYVVRTLL